MFNSELIDHLHLAVKYKLVCTIFHLATLIEDSNKGYTSTLLGVSNTMMCISRCWITQLWYSQHDGYLDAFSTIRTSSGDSVSRSRKFSTRMCDINLHDNVDFLLAILLVSVFWLYYSEEQKNTMFWANFHDKHQNIFLYDE